MQFGRLKRREFITLLGGVAAARPRGRSRRARSSRGSGASGFSQPCLRTPAILSAFRDGLRGRGYVEGQNLSIDVRWPQGTFDQDPSVVTELVNSNGPAQNKSPGCLIYCLGLLWRTASGGLGG